MPTEPVLRKSSAPAGRLKGRAAKVTPPAVGSALTATGPTAPSELAARRFGLAAAFWRRVLARLLDSLAVFWIEFALVVMGAAFWVAPLTDRIHPGPWGRAFVATITYAVFLVIYEVVFITANGQTPGKDLLKIKVVRVVDGETPTLNQALRRSLVHAALCVVPKAWLASLAQFAVGLTSLRSPMRRSLADHVAGTQVVYFDNPIPRPRATLWERPHRVGGHLFKR
jgi:uncharacterized RDD family membrane protein YckC